MATRRTAVGRPIAMATAMVALLVLSGSPASVEAQLRDPEASPAKAAALSALLPGAGQYVLDQDRSWAYLAVEAMGWAFYIDRRSDGSRLRTAYRDFAWMEARLRSAARIDGDFEYYERLSKWRSSGRFDGDPAAPGVQPEGDAATFNGATWVLATQLFLTGGASVPESDPRYQRALDYYRERAYGPEFLWDWTGKEAQQEEFGSLIRRSDDRFRQATNILGVVLVNHVVSMVDAFVSAQAPGTSVQSGLAPTSTGDLLWTARIDVAVPW